jgi:hypothetical protein
MSSSTMNKYWIPHLDIHKKVITAELQFYLGPNATVRSFTKDVCNSTPSETLTARLIRGSNRAKMAS